MTVDNSLHRNRNAGNWDLIPLLVVGDVGKDPYGSGKDSGSNKDPVGSLLREGDPGPRRSRNPGLVGEGADSHGGNSSGQVQSHFVFILSSLNEVNQALIAWSL